MYELLPLPLNTIVAMLLLGPTRFSAHTLPIQPTTSIPVLAILNFSHFFPICAECTTRDIWHFRWDQESIVLTDICSQSGESWVARAGGFGGSS